MPTFILVLVSSLSLIGMFLLTVLTSAYRRLHHRDGSPPIFLGRGWLFSTLRSAFFRARELEGTLFCVICSLNILRFIYTLFAVSWLKQLSLPPFSIEHPEFLTSWSLASVGLLLLLFAIAFFVGDTIPRSLGTHYPNASVRICFPVASLFLVVTFPLCYALYWLSRWTIRTNAFDLLNSPAAQVKQEIIDLIHNLDVPSKLEPQDRTLIESVVQFRGQLAKEVMVPRVEVFSLPGKTPIREAARLLDEEGYSRIPVYGTTVDEILGVLMYKDIIHVYLEYEQSGKEELLNAPIQTLLKDVVFAPETKRISQLLQEFRQRQVHMAIVVDEYGGTEGIVTIEDILEQIVGEIADEYDYEEEMFAVKPEGGWVVDARMSILDVEDKLGVAVPQAGDYDTLAGFVFHCAGSIPPKGFVIHRDTFELEVLASNDRMVEEVWLRSSHPQVKTE